MSTVRTELPGGATVDLGRLFPMQPPLLPGGRWLLGAVILTVLLGVFWACGVFDRQTTGVPWGPPLFFSVLIAYIVPIFGYISERTAAALDVLAPVLDATPAQQREWQRRIFVKPVRWFVAVMLIGLASGLAHNLLLYGSVGAAVAEAVASLPGGALVAGTLLVWIVLTMVVAGLLDNALLLNRLAHRARVQPFDTRRLRPFATVSVISTLALIGAQAAFPVMTLEGGVDPLAYIPGLLATGLPMLIIAALPVWPVHRRLAAAKRRMLTELNEHICTLPLPQAERPESVAQLAPLLTYRREVALMSEWPFDVNVVARLGLYLIIPPLTWVGAALIEHLVETFL